VNSPGRDVLARAVFLVGPTSAGKSEVALALARRHGGEIVCADAFQLYREFPVLSAQPSAAERGAVPHHLFGVVPCREEMDAARYAQLALERVAEIDARGGRPFVVGGSGLYLQALMAGLPELPAVDDAIRERVRGMSLQDMLSRLDELDRESLLAIDVHNPRRVARRLELCLQTGRPASGLLPELPVPEGLRGVLLVRGREGLDLRIAEAVRARLAGGAVEEVRAARGVAGGTARQILGWREIIALLDGEITRTECRERLARATRRYAKRQLTWFRGKSTFPTETISSVTPDNLDRIARHLGLP
jgi:tRNA dimethylallyltransferase